MRLTKIQKSFWRFIELRETMRLVKEDMDNGELEPGLYSADPVLAAFHFCNVNREDDRVTKWIHEHVRLKYAKRPLWYVTLQLLVCRVFNEPEVLKRILPYDGNLSAFKQRLKIAEREVGKLLRGAYLMVPHGRGATVISFFAPAIASAMTDLKGSGIDWEHTARLRSISDVLIACSGVGPFIANQVCTDLRYVPHSRGSGYKGWDDYHSYILCGPGTCRGLNRYFGRPVKRIPGTKKPDYEEEIRWLLANHVADNCPKNLNVHVFEDPNNLSNCFCEFDKYMRAWDQMLAGEPPRLHRRYSPHQP